MIFPLPILDPVDLRDAQDQVNLCEARVRMWSHDSMMQSFELARLEQAREWVRYFEGREQESSPD